MTKKSEKCGQDRKTRKLRHKRKLTSSDSSSDTSESESDTNPKEAAKIEYPSVPQLQTSVNSAKSNNGDSENRMLTPSKRLKFKPSVENYSTTKNDQKTEVEVKEKSEAFSLEYDEIEKELNKNEEFCDFSDEENKSLDLDKQDLKRAGENRISDVSDDFKDNDEKLVEECQNHEEENAEGFAIILLQNFTQPILVPSKWQSLDFKYCYWPPEGTVNIIKEYVAKKVGPRMNWRKIDVLENYTYEETYAKVMKKRLLHLKQNSTS
ncbi:uncharacterized protein LOC131663407 isoform X2 [Phymastichus coffea]|uniref:uncharacterized protein LOC131663407 isoform X2 n=1 Tax=Phymastichus coffea TaxID=108790 RepID=UPI00273BE125|nr:uncharacterized protein LOC131663407 isoform X2 [Phymastichus coffea]